ncbi:MAG: protease complex subunit PrcB family protein [Steroidobacteraceae bacterium]
MPRDAGIRRLPAAGAGYALQSGFDTAGRHVVRNSEEWQRAWAVLTARVPGAGPTPGIDFGREMIVIVTQGLQRSGGHSIRVAGARIVAGELVLRVVLQHPAPGCIVPAAVTFPANVVAVRRWTGRVRYAESEYAEPCAQ